MVAEIKGKTFLVTGAHGFIGVGDEAPARGGRARQRRRHRQRLRGGETRWQPREEDGLCGPFIATRDEVADVQALRIEGRLTGEVMQSLNTSKMIFGVFRQPPVLLEHGDVFEVEGLGTLMNTFVNPK